MKKYLLFSMLFLASGSFVFGQTKLRVSPELLKPVIKPKAVLENDAPQANQGVKPVDFDLPTTLTKGLEIPIGETTYDLQTNSSIQNRLNMRADGQLAAAWIMGADGTAAAPDRGSGYNSTTDGDWGGQPGIRLESQRCGWPSITSDLAGNEAVISHATATSPYSLSIMTKAAGSDTWVESNLASSVQPHGVLWPRTAAAGDYLHVIAISTPVAFPNGGVVDGLDGTIQYFRSSDGGQTFDLTEVSLPGLDSTFYGGIGPDSYAIHARGSTVAIAVFEGWGDMAIWKSMDNGDTWTKTIAYDFPLNGYSADDGYTFEMIQDFYTEGANPDSLAIPTTDGSGAVIIDITGMVHIAAGFTYVMDNVLTDGGTSFFPGFGDMWYWNEAMGAGEAGFVGELTTWSLDLNGDDSLGISGTLPAYGNGLMSYPSLAIDDENAVIMSFAAIQEDALDDASQMNFRHTLVSRTLDNGETWQQPIDLSDSPYGIDELAPISEVVYGSLLQHEVNNEMHMVYQRDFTPGLAVIGDMHANLGSSIHYVSFPNDLIASTEVPSFAVEFDIYPNPSAGEFTLEFEMVESKDVSINVLNLLGQPITNLFAGKIAQGAYQQNFSKDLSPGIYVIEIRAEDEVYSKKMLITGK